MAGSKVVQMVGPSYHLADRKAAIQSAINCYPQRLEGDAWMMAGSPGEVTIESNVSGELRGSRNVEGVWYLAIGSSLVSLALDPVTGNWLGSTYGTLLTTTGFVGMAHNSTQLAIVDGPYLYILTLATGAFTQILSSGWRGSNDVHELDGYFLFVAPDSDQFYLSQIDDGSNLDALDFSSADSAPDLITTHRVLHRQVWFFGEDGAEIWIDSGSADFPFVRYQSYTLDVGIVGERAAINAADTLFWIGKTRNGSGIVYMLQGNQPQRVSQLAVEEALRSSRDLSQATMWAYQVEGHEFIGIDAPGLTSTWVYDAAMQQWHERGEWDGGFKPLRSRLVTAYGGEHYAGNSDGDIVRLDPNANTLSGRPLVRERTWPHLIQDSMEPISFRGLELAMKTGYGGSVTLQISNDGGFTFGAPLIRSLGEIGQWMQRIRWLGLGTAINRVFRIRVSDDVPFAIHSAAMDT